MRKERKSEKREKKERKERKSEKRRGKREKVRKERKGDVTFNFSPNTVHFQLKVALPKLLLINTPLHIKCTSENQKWIGFRDKNDLKN